ncbi:hypothetical protein GTO27_03245 [Candidatus Bathyarchaeota archaeon]|nr:hypothetical protein [Candidatus Bathyarchaeota archaeon]
MNIVKWTPEKADKLLEPYERDYTYEETAEALTGRSVGAVRVKLRRLKREKREDTYIGGGGVRTQRGRPFIFWNFGGKTNRINVQYI